MQLCFVSVHGPRETYFADEPRITITILDIIYRPVFYLKHDVLETGFCLRLQVEAT
jgi:hypothetical protein